jgi:hypothetical protein
LKPRIQPTVPETLGTDRLRERITRCFQNGLAAASIGGALDESIRNCCRRGVQRTKIRADIEMHLDLVVVENPGDLVQNRRRRYVIVRRRRNGRHQGSGPVPALKGAHNLFVSASAALHTSGPRTHRSLSQQSAGR